MTEHTHTHSHSHDHDHDHDGDSYFIDQLCMVGLSGAFGAICLCLAFWQTGMLTLMLGKQFHNFVLASGFVLVVLAFLRGAILWSQSRDPAFLHAHDHAHHDHDHHNPAHEHGIQEKAPHQQSVQSLPMHQHGAGCGHEHAPGETCAHDHGHEQHAHAAGHHHHHDHDEADHDHGWAPWRYVVILVPIILFLLGLPNKPPTINAFQGTSALTPMQEAEPYLFGIGTGADPLAQLVHFGVALRQSGQGEKVNYQQLEGMASAPDLRASNKDKVVEVRGQYSPYPGSTQIFMLVRIKISCCANDAVQLHVPMISREPITGIQRSDWVKVTGRIDFRERNGKYDTVLVISKASDVVKCDPEVNPYIQ